ncbi:hypothetical protein GCM10029964_002250 [Kibdelosporangium lantanae]
MRTKNLLMGIVALGLTAGVVAAPAALAGPPEKGQLGISPQSGKPGDTVQLTGVCRPWPQSAPVTSDAIEAPDLRLSHASGQYLLEGKGKVKTNVKPGKYSVGFMCNGALASTTFEVLPSDTTTPPPVTSTRPKPPTSTKVPTTKPKAPQVVVKPKAAPETGGGGSAS